MGTRKKGLEFAKHISEIIAKATGFERHLEKVRGNVSSCLHLIYCYIYIYSR